MYGRRPGTVCRTGPAIARGVRARTLTTRRRSCAQRLAVRRASRTATRSAFWATPRASTDHVHFCPNKITDVPE